MKKILLITICMFASDVAFALSNRVLLEFNTAEYDTTLVWLSQVQMRGAIARHIFVPNKVILDIGGIPPESLTDEAGRWTVYSAAKAGAPVSGTISDRVRVAFNHLVSRPTDQAGTEPSPPLLNCLDCALASGAKRAKRIDTVTDFAYIICPKEYLFTDWEQ